MIYSLKHKHSIAALLFFVSGLLIIIATYRYPIGDFGNYYYGSKIFLEGNFSLKNYKDISYFNQQIAVYGETHYFENYIPVPPFSLLFYLPFAILKSIYAKVFFNLISLSVFSFSLYRLLKYLTANTLFLYFLPVVFFYPLYNNIMQGQAYLLVTALLIEAYIASEKNKQITASVFLAVTISLKIFPGFILFYFLVKKNYKSVLYTILISLILYLMTGLAAGFNTITYYAFNVIPRLMNNDIIGSYYHGNQSVYTLLLNLFSRDALHNPNPLFENQYLVIATESLFITMVLWILIQIQKKGNFLFYCMVLFSSLLVGRYNTSYALLLLIPLAVYLFIEWPDKKLITVLILCLTVTINLPIGSFIDMAFVFKFSRLFGLLLLLLFTVYLFETKFLLKPIILLLIPVFCIKYLTYSVQPIRYFHIQNSKGILSDWKIQRDSITLISTLGDKMVEEKFKLHGCASKEKTLMVSDNSIYYKNKLVCYSPDNKKNPFIFNDSLVVFLSDLNQGIGFYKLRIIPLHR